MTVSKKAICQAQVRADYNLAKDALKAIAKEAISGYGDARPETKSWRQLVGVFSPSCMIMDVVGFSAESGERMLSEIKQGEFSEKVLWVVKADAGVGEPKLAEYRVLN